MSLRLEPTEVNGMSAFALENDSLRLVVVPELGGKIVSLLSLRTGREWLWKNPYIPFAKPAQDTTDFGSHDSGGWDEIFPTVNPCSMPGTGWGDRQLTDHGELWYRPWRIVNQKTEAQAIELTLCVEPDDLPFRFLRTLRLTTDALEVDYQLTNTGSQSLPYLWAAHPLIAIVPGNEILIPENTLMSSTGVMYLDLAKNKLPSRWPNLSLNNGKSLNLSRVPEQDANFGIKLFAEDAFPRRVGIFDHAIKECLSVTFSESIAHCGLWLNYGAWTGADTHPYFNLGLEPTNLPGDDLSIVSHSDTTPPLAPQETHEWSISMRVER